LAKYYDKMRRRRHEKNAIINHLTLLCVNLNCRQAHILTKANKIPSSTPLNRFCDKLICCHVTNRRTMLKPVGSQLLVLVFAIKRIKMTLSPARESCLWHARISSYSEQAEEISAPWRLPNMAKVCTTCCHQWLPCPTLQNHFSTPRVENGLGERGNKKHNEVTETWPPINILLQVFDINC